MANILFQSTEHFLKDAEKKAPEEMELSQLEVIQQVIVKVAQHMEDKAKLKQIQEGCAQLLYVQHTHKIAPHGCGWVVPGWRRWSEPTIRETWSCR
jgi:hypothetical protein